MIKKKEIFKVIGCLIFIFILFGSCSDGSDNQEPMEEEKSPKGSLLLQITDSPLDDANVKAVFITIAALELDGQEFVLDNPKTIEISALNHGKVETIFNIEVEAKNHTQLNLILAGYNNEQYSNYVLTQDDIKHNLMISSNPIKVTIPVQNIEIMENGDFNAIIDFDLRKSIVYDYNTDSDQYNFVNNLNGVTRFIHGETFKVEGEVSDQLGISDEKVVVYAYAKGTFNSSAETTGEIQFTQAVSSSAVNEDGQFSIHFLKEDNYELVLANYKEMEDGRLMFESLLNTEVLAGINLSVVSLDADITTNLAILGKLEL